MKVKKYPRRESNPYPHFCRQDFKSCASTCSATRVNGQKKSFPPETRRKRSASAKAPADKSGRPGSNRPPRPWQGRALPNELLPLINIHKNLRGAAKIRIPCLSLKFFTICIRVYTGYWQELLLPVCLYNDVHTIHRSRLSEVL